MNLFTLQFSKAGYVADYLAYGAWVIGCACFLVHFGPRGEWPEITVLVGGGVFAWSLIEYLLHRFVLHGIDPFRRWHAAHHESPAALIGIPTVFSACLFCAFVFIPAVALTDLWKGTGLTLGVVSGYLAYGWTHHAAHHWRPGTPWLHRRKRQHAIHHRTNDRCFGVTPYFWDWVFRSGSP